MTGSSPVDRSKLGTKRHILTDKKGIPLSAAISSASTHDIKLVTDVIDNSIIKRTFVSGKPKKGMGRRKYHHLCLDRAYQSKSIEQEIIKRGYVPHIPYKRKRGQVRKENTDLKRYTPSKNKRWVVEREQIHGIIGSESCLQGMKRRLRTTLDWYIYRAVSLSIER